MKFMFLSIGIGLIATFLIAGCNKSSQEEKAGQLIVLGVFPDKEQALQEGVTYDPEIYFREAITKWNVGAVFFKRKWTKEQLQQKIAMAKALRPDNPPLIFLDMEWGLAMRCKDVEPLPKAGVMGEQDNENGTYAWAVKIGQQAKEVGVDLVLGPVADINTNPQNPVIGVRAFGNTTERVEKHVQAFLHGIHSTGVHACLKHFPGHGDTLQDSHLTLPTVSSSLERLKKVELKPFQVGISSGASCVMTAHIVLPQVTGDCALPATFSQQILEEILRNEMGFKGVILSDDLFMKAIGENYMPGDAAVRALTAGCDMILATQDIEEMIPAIAQLDDKLLDAKLSRVSTTLRTHE